MLDLLLLVDGFHGTMSTPTEVQALLRFLSQDAKVPLSTAMGKMKELQEAFLTRYAQKCNFHSSYARCCQVDCVLVLI